MSTTISANINSFEVDIVPAIKARLLLGCPFTDAILVAPSDSPVETVTSPQAQPKLTKNQNNT